VTGLMVAGDVVLTTDERRLLARDVTHRYEEQRYGATWDPDPEQRRRLLLRWQAIADAFHPAPYGPSHRAAELAQRAREAAEEGVVTMTTCPGWRDDGTFDPEACIADTWHDLPDDSLTHAAETECRCTNWCGDPGEAGCCYCNHTDVYAPCPVVGFGCGTGGNTRRCDCCTDEEWAAAGGAA